MKKSKRIVSLLGVGIVTVVGVTLFKSIRVQITLLEKKREKFRSYYELLNEWLKKQHEKTTLIPYFTEHEYKTIAIYGMGEIGKRLYEELKDSDIKVLYAIDQYDSYDEILDIKLIDDDLPEVDAVIVTPVADFDEIYSKLSTKVNYPIISMEEVIAGC